MASYAVDRAAWADLSAIDQMANIGAEVGRALAAKRAGRQARANAAAMRALDLFSATEDLWIAEQPQRVREVSRARDEFLACMFDAASEEDVEGVERFFAQYGIASRRRRE